MKTSIVAVLVLIMAVACETPSHPPVTAAKGGAVDEATRSFSNKVSQIAIRSRSFTNVTIVEAAQTLSRESGVNVVCEKLNDQEAAKKFTADVGDAHLLKVLGELTERAKCAYRIDKDRLVITPPVAATGQSAKPDTGAASGPSTNTTNQAGATDKADVPKYPAVGMAKAQVLKITGLTESAITKYTHAIDKDAIEVWVVWRTAQAWYPVQTTTSRQVIIRFQNGTVSGIEPTQ
jgi:hypothetical protein